MKNKVEITSNNSLGDGIEWSDLKTLCEKIDVPFNNQSLGQLLTVLDAMKN
jgi:hypothetical protein